MMNPAAWFVLGILLPFLLLTASGKLRAELAALSMAAILGVAQLAGLGVLGEVGKPASVARAIAGFSQPVVITLLSLFIITRCMEHTGLTRWIARHLLRLAGSSQSRLIALFAATTAFLSLFMNNLAAGALLLPAALEASRRTGVRPSKLLIPVAYGSLLGGAATYFTSANIIVSDLLSIATPPQKPLGILDFTPTGGLIALAGIAFLALFGRRLLPDHEPPISLVHWRPTSTELEQAYQVGERLWKTVISEISPLAGKTLHEAAFGEKLGIAAAAIQRGKTLIFPLTAEQTLLPGDTLYLIGRAERIARLNEEGLDPEEMHEPISQLGLSFVELLLAPRSPAEGHTLKELNFRRRYGFTAIALYRKGRSYRTNVADFPLEAGDSLLMAGELSNLPLLRRTPDFVVLEPSLSDQPVQRRGAAITAGVTLAAIVASILGVPVYLAMLIGALLVILAGVISMEEATRAVEWKAIFLIAGMYAVSLAMVQTGLADASGKLMVHLASPFGALGLAAGAYLLSALLTQVMGGQVTALVSGPVVISAAIRLGVSPQAVAVAAAIACSASFLTPLAHPVNILMIGPANYRFSDFFKVGWPLTLISFIMLLAGMKLFWGL